MPEVKACACQTRIGCMLELEYHYNETGLSSATIPNGIRNDSLLLRDNQPQQQRWVGEMSSSAHFSGGAWCWRSGHLASTLTHPSLLGNTGHCPALGRWPPGTRASTHQSALLWVPCSRPSFSDKEDWKKNLQSLPAVMVMMIINIYNE